MNLILIDAADPGGASATLHGVQARHVREVLRATVGQSLRIGIVDGAMGTGVITHVDEQVVRLDLALGAVPERPRVDLLLAVPRPKVLRRLWAQLAALGVGRIVLTNAARVERNFFDTHLLAPDGYRPLLLEGLRQARDTRVPAVSVHRQFRKLVEDDLAALSDATVRLVADPSAATSVADVTALHAASGGRALLAIGPEGGWNAFELDLLARHGFEGVGMGPRTLRSDTACLALLALLHDALRTGVGQAPDGRIL